MFFDSKYHNVYAPDLSKTCCHIFDIFGASLFYLSTKSIKKDKNLVYSPLWSVFILRVLHTVKLGYNEFMILTNKLSSTGPKWWLYFRNVHGYNELTVIMNIFPRSRRVRYNRVWLYLDNKTVPRLFSDDHIFDGWISDGRISDGRFSDKGIKHTFFPTCTQNVHYFRHSKCTIFLTPTPKAGVQGAAAPWRTLVVA